MLRSLKVVVFATATVLLITSPLSFSLASQGAIQADINKDAPTDASLKGSASQEIGTTASSLHAIVEPTENVDLLGIRMKVSDTLMVVFTGLLFGATVLLWWTTRRLVSGADESSERTLRAYVSMTPRSVMDFGCARQVTVDCIMKNHGKTPAFKINHAFEIAVADNPLPPTFVYHEPKKIVSVDAALFPDAETFSWFHFDRHLSWRELRAIALNKKRLHFWGETSYSDAFGKVWSTKFNASVGGKELLGAARAARRRRAGPEFRWVWGPKHGQST